jgi:hypothetical protein
MAKQRLGTDFKLPLKSSYDTVDCTLIVEVEGSKVPNLEIIGRSFDAARQTFMDAIHAAHTQPKEQLPVIEATSPPMVT